MSSRFFKPQAEEVVIAGLVGALVAVAATSLITAGAQGYLPHDMHGIVDSLRVVVFWIAVVVGGGAGVWFGVTQEKDTHVSGVLYYPIRRRAMRFLRARERRQMSKTQRAGKVRGIAIGGVEFARRTETTHFTLLGLNGTGKTTILDAMERQVMARGDRLIIHDIKGDFTAAHYDPATCVLMGAQDPEAWLWDATRDIATPAQADAFAARVFDVRNVDPKDRHWYTSAATLLSGAIRYYMSQRKPWRWSDIADMWEDDHVELVTRAAQGNSQVRQNFPNFFRALAAGKEPSISPEEASIFSTVADDFGWILRYAALDRADPTGKRFSVREWVLGKGHKDIRTVILNFSSNDAQVCEQLFGAILAAVATTLGSSELPEIDADRGDCLWLVLDEFAQLGPRAFRAVQTISELGRSKGARVVLATQTSDQLAARVGAAKAEPVMHQQRTRIYLQTSPEDAEKISATAGSHTIERISTTAENGAVQGKTKTIVRERALLPGDITGLRQGPDAGGVELLVQTGDRIFKLLQPFGPQVPEHAPRPVSKLWEQGTLRYTDATQPAPAPTKAPTPAADDAPPAPRTAGGDGKDPWGGDYGDGSES